MSTMWYNCSISRKILLVLLWGNFKKEGMIIFSIIRKRIRDIKDNFYSAKEEKLDCFWSFINLICVNVVFVFIYLLGFTFYILNFKVLGVLISAIATVYIISASISTKIFDLTANISFGIVQYLLRYGKVVTKKDWKNIKKKCNTKIYNKLLTSESCGYCYYYSRIIALFLEDAQLMYCSIELEDRLTAHAVVVKNNCVYDTNYRRHIDYEEYIEKEKVTIYKMFSADEYRKESFFDDIRQGFVDWCVERNVYCDPQ